MSKYLILFNSPIPMSEFMNNSTPEERQSGLEAWMNWYSKLENSVKFEFGSVVEAKDRIDNTNITKSPNQASNYAFIEADSKEDVISSLKNHPHLNRIDANIDILEILQMPKV